MKFVEPSATIMCGTAYKNAVRTCCTAASLCYGKPVPNTLEEQEAFIRSRIKAGHESVIEHAGFSALLLTDRGVTHELVRHRLASYTQESTRYALKKGMELTYILPESLSEDDAESLVFKDVLAITTMGFETLRDTYKKPLDLARQILPNCLATQIVVTANMREWRHIFNLRVFGTTGRPHPEMRRVMKKVLKQAKDTYPVFFEDMPYAD